MRISPIFLARVLFMTPAYKASALIGKFGQWHRFFSLQ